MPEPHGQFGWYELMTNDTAGATAFYTRVVGWGAEDAGNPAMAYTLLTLGGPGRGVAGLTEMPEEVRAAAAHPFWIGYVMVDDVDAMAARVTEAGGKVHRGPADIPEVGRFAVVADPQGARFVLFKGMGNPPPKPPRGTPGLAGWHELHADDWQAAFGFYAGLFGWTKSTPVDMGPMGTYQTFDIGGGQGGGMMNKIPGAAPYPFWTYYFNVDDIDAAASRVKEAGGQVVHGPQEVPGGSWVLNGVDPQGAFFSLVKLNMP